MSDGDRYDIIVIGAGIAGSLIAKHATRAGLSVLMLEAGPETPARFDTYQQHVEDFYRALVKGPESAWAPAVAVPQPDTADLRNNNGYFIQNGPHTYGSTYSRIRGGSTLHWLGVCLRMLPEDFRLRSRYGVGRDWPLSYDQLEPYYRLAEQEIGVAADVADQEHLGVWFAQNYDYPMQRIPLSFSDRALAADIDGMPAWLQLEKFSLKVRGYPAGRNSTPRAGYIPRGAVDQDATGRLFEQYVGERCAGNTSCTPICPIQAKYNAGKTLAQADWHKLRLLTQAVASEIKVDPGTGQVQEIAYKRYEDPKSPQHVDHVARARIYVLAAHAIENAKLMLISKLGSPDGPLGANLMDHPTLYMWGQARRAIGPYRGPLSTAGIEDLRGGKFRERHAAFRFDIGNDGWRAATGAPDTTVTEAVTKMRLFGTQLREHLSHTLQRQVRFSLAVEQLPNPTNHITIDRDKSDPLGLPRPVIHYQIDDYTLRGMAEASRIGREIFARAKIQDCTDPSTSTWFPSVTYNGTVFNYHGMGHFAGTHVMGTDSADSVVDPDQRSHAHRNLYLVGAGSFPTMGTSNPTLTIAALALRTVRHLISELNG
jgi:choline dehydrogenase-like flavoprotein